MVRATAPTDAIDTKTAIASEGPPALDATERERKWPNVRPRSAATLIIVDRQAAEPKILMGRRHTGHVFMPGKFVFPGGRIEPTDRLMGCAAALHPTVEAKLMAAVARPSASRARALALAAIRETFEETGLLLGTKQEAPSIVPPPGPWTDFVSHGVLPSLADMHFVARAITPPRRPRRFDAAFFAVDASAIVHKVDGIVGPEAELTELVWLPLEEARRLDLPTITGVVLKELEARVAAGMSHELPVPFYNERHRRWYRDEL